MLYSFLLSADRSMASSIKVFENVDLCNGYVNSLSIYNPPKPTITGLLFAGKPSKPFSLKLRTRSCEKGKWRRYNQNADKSSDALHGSVDVPPPLILVEHLFYGINAKDLESLDQLLTDDCIFMDLIFYMPHGGKQSILSFLGDAMDASGPNIRFSVDEMRMLDESTAVVNWHLEWKTQEIPFTAGCTAFNCEEIDGKTFVRRIISLQELPLKTGELVLKLLKATGTLLDNFPAAAEVLLQKSHGDRRNILEYLGIIRKT